MQRIVRPSGVEIEIGDSVTVSDESGAPAAAGRGGRLPTGPTPLQAPGGAGGIDDPIVQGLLTQQLELVEAFGMAGGGTVRAAPEAARATLEVAENEDAVALIEQGGVYEWRRAAPGAAQPIGAQRRGAMLVPGRRRITIELTPAGPAPGAPAPAPGARRGLIDDFVLDKVRAYVFKFIARAALPVAIGFLERNVQRGLVRIQGADCSAWQRIESLQHAGLAADRPLRILLLVHGTFSSTVGSYGALGASPWGQGFIAAALAAYDIVLGFDHPTLSEDPAQNATALLAALETLPSPHPPVIDAVAFSRGGLVLRALIEFLLPGSRLRAVVRRAAFVGATNGGTQLASPENWERFIDLYTNLAAAAGKVLKLLGAATPAGLIVAELIRSLGQLVKYLVATAAEERRVPGLAAMDPKGAFVKRINGWQPGQPPGAESLYYVVASNFDASLAAAPGDPSGLPARLLAWLADAFADSLMREPNDLVVNTRAMSELDAAAGQVLTDRIDLPPAAHVYHTIYFTRPEVVGALARWLGLEGAGAARRGASLPAAVDPSIVTVKADEPFFVVMDHVKLSNPMHVVVKRTEKWTPEPYYYAFTSDELLDVERSLKGTAPAGITLADAFIRASSPLQETKASPRVQVGKPLPIVPSGKSSTGRVVVFRDKAPIGVAGGIHIDLKDYAAGKPARAFGGGGVHGISAMSGRAAGAGAGLAGAGPVARAVRSAPARSAALNPAAMAVPATMQETHFTATMPEAVPLNVTVTVEVHITQAAMTITVGPTAQQVAAKVDLSRDLLVQIIAKTNLETLGDDRVLLTPEEVSAWPTLRFDVRATHAGEAELLVVARQGPRALASMSLKPKVDPALAAPRGMMKADAEAAAGALEPLTYPILEITEKQNGASLNYEFILIAPGGVYLRKESRPIVGERKAYVDSIYKQIESRWLGSNADVARFEQELRVYGATLLDELVPPDIQAELWKARDTLGAIQVLSEEPFIPWELVHLKDPGKVLGAEKHFLAQKGLVRWLNNHHNAPQRIEVRKGRAFYAVPDYPDARYKLPEAQKEIQVVTDSFAAQPAPDTSTELCALLRVPGNVDLLHFAGHGQAEGGGIGESKILLLGRVQGGNYVPDVLTSEQVKQLVSLATEGANRPVVVLNACQAGRANWQLTSMGGFAEAFIHAGAGIFVSSLWSVGDEPALVFTRKLYENLIGKGRTLAAAASAARAEASGKGEATWLAYSVYGHPLASVTVVR